VAVAARGIGGSAYRQGGIHSSGGLPNEEDFGFTVTIDVHDRWLAVLAFFLAAMIYNANFRSISTGDSRATRYIPFALWHDQTVYLDSLLDLTVDGFETRQYWVKEGRNGRQSSTYPVTTPVLVAPLYLPAVFYLESRGWRSPDVTDVSFLMEKLAASFVASLSVGGMYLVLRRRTDRRNALLLTGAYAFGTTTWAISSQALWQHGPAQLMVVALLWLLTGPPSALRSLAAGAATGLLVAIRPSDIPIAIAFGVGAILWSYPRKVELALFALSSLIPVVLVGYYNVATFGNLAGGYALLGISSKFFSHSRLEGLAGLLASPTRGLFVFSPFLLFLPFLFRRSWRDKQWKSLTLVLGGGILLQLAFYSGVDFRQGYSFGPRFLTDMLPILIWMMAPVLPTLSKPLWAGFLVATAVAIWIQSVGAFQYTDSSNRAIFQPTATTAEAWKWGNSPFIEDATGPRQPATMVGAVLRLSNR